MTEMVLDVQALPETIFSRISSRKVKFFEENGTITLTPFAEENGNIVLSPDKNKPNANELFGMFNDGKLSSFDFIKQKVIEKEMEN